MDGSRALATARLGRAGLAGLAGMVGLVGLGLACAGAREVGPQIAPEAAGSAAVRAPVVFVPGVTGSKLRRLSGEVVFGEARQFFLPRDGGHGLARSLRPGPQAPLEAFDLLRTLRIPPIYRKQIYRPIIDLLVAEGYRLGEVERPQPGASLFLYAYDWRQDNVESAASLARALESIRQATGSATIDLICQSNGAHVCRYAARYGDRSLEQAELELRGSRQQLSPKKPGIGRLILVGASNGGSLRILRELNHGRRYIPVLGRKFQPEIFFTFPSLFQDLPAAGSDLFVDGSGATLEVDLYDAKEWERYGWSVFAEASRKRSEGLATPELRRRHLVRMLDRAQRFQALLASEISRPRVAEFHLIENASQPTPSRAALVRGADGWRTLFADDRWVRARPQLEARLVEAGDGHATIASQRDLTAQEWELLAAPPLRVGGGHFEMLLSERCRRYLLEALAPDDLGESSLRPSRVFGS